VEGFVHFLNFGLHHQLYVIGDLVADAGDEAEEAADFGDAVMYRVPGNLWLGEIEFLRQLHLRAQAILAE
jgi:hypothetical protein